MEKTNFSPVIKSVLTNVNNASADIERLLNQLRDFEDCYSLKNSTVEEKTIVRGLFTSLIDKLEDATALIEFYKKPILKEGQLHKKGNGRYALDDTEFSCGSVIELLYDKYKENSFEWLKTRIEAKNGQYYAIGFTDELEGARARIR